MNEASPIRALAGADFLLERRFVSASGRNETPVDKLTGQPYPIRLEAGDLSLEGAFHHVRHPKFRPELGFPRHVSYDDMIVDAISMGIAARCSSVQWVPNVYHFDGQPRGYHAKYWGPYIEDDATSQFVTVGLDLSGVRPRTGIELHKGRVRTRGLNNRDHEIITDPKISRPEGNNPISRAAVERVIGHAIINYALEQQLPLLLDQAAVKRFKEARNNAKKRRAGRQIINLSVSRAIEEQIMPVYAEAAVEGMVPKRGWQNPHDAIFDILLEEEYFLHYDQLKLIIESDLARAA